MLSYIELIQRNNQKETNTSDVSLSKKEEKNESLLSLIKNEKIIDIKNQDKLVKPRKPRQDKNLKQLQQSNSEQQKQQSNLIDNFTLNNNKSTNSSNNCGIIIDAGGSISSVSEPSRSSSSIDTGSCNTDELLLASNHNSPIDSPINPNDLNDLSCSSRHSSLNDIGLDVELEQIMINNLDYLPCADMIPKTNESLVVDDKEIDSKIKTKQFFNANTNGKKLNRQPNYCNRNRRSRIVRTPLPPQPTYDISNENNNIETLSNDYKLPINQELNNKKIDLGINDYILLNNEENLSKRVNHSIKHCQNNNNNNKTNWTSYYENEKIDVNSENQFVNEINKRRKKWNFFPPNSEFNKNNNDNTTNSSSNSSSSNELNDNVTVFKPKQLHKNINQKIQQLQSQQQNTSPPAQQQQTDYPVFKYLSKNLMNNLFTTKESSSNSENNKQFKMSITNNNNNNNKKQNLNLNKTEELLTTATTTETTSKPTSDQTSLTNSINIRKHSTSNYNYLINKYSTMTSSAAAAATSVSNTSSSNTCQLKSIFNKNNTTTISNKDQDINPIVASIINDLISDVIDSLDKKKSFTNNLEEIVSSSKQLFFTNKAFLKNEIDTKNTTSDFKSNFKFNKPTPLIKTLINDINQLNKINPTNCNIDLDNLEKKSLIVKEIDKSFALNKNIVSLSNEDDADVDSDSIEEVVNLADNAILININYEMEHTEPAKSITNLNDKQICDDENANWEEKTTNQIFNNEKIIITKSNTNNINDNLVINKAFVYARNNESINSYINKTNHNNNNNDDYYNINENKIIKSNDPNYLSNFNNYNNININYAKLNNHKDYVEVTLKEVEEEDKNNNNKNNNNNITNYDYSECSNNNNKNEDDDNDLKLNNFSIQTKIEMNNNNNNNNNSEASDNNLQDIIQYPSFEPTKTTTSTTTTKSEVFLINSNSNNNLYENTKLNTIENSDMTDLKENNNNNNNIIIKNAKQTDSINSGQTNSNAVLNQNHNINNNNDDDENISIIMTDHINKDDKNDNNEDDEDDDKIPDEPPPPPPLSSQPQQQLNDTQLTLESESNPTTTTTTIIITTTKMTITPRENCEIEIENSDFENNNFIKNEDTSEIIKNNNSKENNTIRKENCISTNSNKIINDQNCNYSEQILLNNNNNIIEKDLDKKNSLVEDNNNKIEISNNLSEIEVVSIFEKKDENSKIDLIIKQEKDEQQDILFAISTNDKLVNNSNKENNTNNNIILNNENSLLFMNEECNKNSNENKNNNEINSKLEFELFSKQQQAKNNITYKFSKNNNINNNNNVENNDSMNNEIETEQIEQESFINDEKTEINNFNNQQEMLNENVITIENSETSIQKLNQIENNGSKNQEIINNNLDNFCNQSEYIGNNTTRVKLKSNEIVLIEDCDDEDEKELDKLIKTKSINTADLFHNPNATTPASRKKASDLFASKSSSFFSNSLSAERQARLSKTENTANSSNEDDDDPYVKAALERFDAFCRSKSSHSLDKNASSSTTTTSTTTNNNNNNNNVPAVNGTSPAAHLINNRNKSPFLTRKTITNPEDEPNFKENIGSFIKRRQARIDPVNNHNNNNSTNIPTNSTLNKNLTESNPDIDQVCLSIPSQNTKVLNRSCSETRTFEDKVITRQIQPPSQATSNTNPMPLSSSSLAKRFLGSLTPQLEPTTEATVNLDLDEKCYENTINNKIINTIKIDDYQSDSIVNEKQDDHKNNEIPIKDVLPVIPPNENAIKPEINLIPKRRQASLPQARPSSAGAELSSHQNNSVNNYSKNITKLIKEEKPLVNENDKKILNDNLNTTTQSNTTVKPNKNFNIIKLEVVNNTTKVKQRNEEKSVSPPHYKTKPPLPPSAPASPSLITSNPNNSAQTSNSSTPSLTSSHSSSWRSKLKSIYNEAPIIDGNTNVKNTTSLSNNLPTAVTQSNEVMKVSNEKPQTKSNSRIIPLEVKNQKTGTVTIVKPNVTTTTTNSRSNNKKDSNFNITPPVPASTLQKSGYLSSNTDRIRSSSSYRASPETSSTPQTSGTSLRNSSSFTYRDLSPNSRSNNGRTLSSSSFHSDSRPKIEQIESNNNDSGSESPDPIAEKACNNFMHKLLEIQRQKPYVNSSALPTSQSTSFTEQSISNPSSYATTTSTTTSAPLSNRVTSLYNDLYKNKSNDNIAGNTGTTNNYPTYSSYLYNSPYSTTLSTINPSSLPAAGVLDSLLSNNNMISSSSSSSLLNSENNLEPPRPYVSAIRKRRTLFCDDGSTDYSNVDNNMSSTVSYFTNNNFTSPYVHEYKSPYTNLLAASSSLNNKNSNASNNSNGNTKVNTEPTNNSSNNFGRNRPLSIVNEESNNNNNNNNSSNNNNVLQTNVPYSNLTRSLSAKDSRNNSTNNETNNFKDDNTSTSLMISNTPTQKLKQSAQVKKSNSITSSTLSRSDEQSTATTTTTTTGNQKLRSTVFDRLAALNNNSTNCNSIVSSL